MFKNNYVALWLLLASALAIILFVAFFDDISIGNYTIRKAPVAETLSARSSDLLPPPIESTDSVTAVSDTVPTDTVPQNFLIFGDSMTYNLALRLAQYAKQNGHTIHAVNWDSSNTLIWAESDTLEYYIRKFRPTQIFISLGSNELYLKDPERRRTYVRRILGVIDTVPYVWIGPPNWTKDSGLNDMIESECRRGAFFRSEGMEFQRKADKVHPTRASSALWIDSIMRWIPKSAHPFRAEIPSDSIGKANPNIIFLKALNK